MTGRQRDQLEAMAGVWEHNARDRRERYVAGGYRDERALGEASAFETAATGLRAWLERP